jgi:DNA-binding NtrC family response regulator
MIDLYQRPSYRIIETGALSKNKAGEKPMRTTGPVLIMESNLDISQLLTICLKLEGYNVQLCEGKQEVLAWIKQAPEPGGMLLLDLSVSLTACEMLVNEIQDCYQRRFSYVPPIIGLTTSIEVYRSFDHPAITHMLIKPFHIRQLRDLVNGKQKTA